MYAELNCVFMYQTVTSEEKIMENKNRALAITNTDVHMVRNHQDGYPYLNLSFFYIQKHKYFGKLDWS